MPEFGTNRVRSDVASVCGDERPLGGERSKVMTIERHGDVTVLRPQGALDACACPRLREEIEGIRGGGIQRVVIDLRHVAFLSSTALGLLLEGARSLTAAGGGLALARPSELCRRIIERIGLARLVPVFDTAEQARSHLAGEGAPRGGPTAGN